MATICKVDIDFDHSFFSGASCAFGVFDGVHKGHQFLLSCAQRSAEASGGKSIALTFDIDPDEMFHADRLKKVMSNEDRIATLAASGVDAVVILPFTKEFASLDPQIFLERTFNGCVPESLHIGSDFRFGIRAVGTVSELEEWGRRLGTTIHAHDLEFIGGQPVSSTRIRQLLANTEIEEANKLLGRPYFIRSQVLPGRGEGKDLGFRTANLKLAPLMQTLGDGTYAAYVEVAGVRYKAAVSVGVSPVFEKQTDATCEAHILDFTGDLYGETIKVEFVHFLRPMIAFESVEELSQTVKSNIAWVQNNL